MGGIAWEWNWWRLYLAVEKKKKSFISSICKSYKKRWTLVSFSFIFPRWKNYYSVISQEAAVHSSLYQKSIIIIKTKHYFVFPQWVPVSNSRHWVIIPGSHRLCKNFWLFLQLKFCLLFIWPPLAHLWSKWRRCQFQNTMSLPGTAVQISATKHPPTQRGRLVG